MEVKNIVDMSCQEVAEGLAIRALNESGQIKHYVLGKIEKLNQYLQECSKYANNFAELPNIIAGAEQYIKMLHDLIEALDKDDQDLKDRVEALYTLQQQTDVEKDAIDQELNIIICKVANIKQVCRAAAKNINISYSRYEHAFEKHKIFYKCFVGSAK
jgi:hypothetical protein